MEGDNLLLQIRQDNHLDKRPDGRRYFLALSGKALQSSVSLLYPAKKLKARFYSALSSGSPAFF
jgi:hypothetical protein